MVDLSIIDNSAEYYKKRDLINRIEQKINAGLPEEDCYEEGYVFILTIDSFDVMNFSLGNCRKVLPVKVRAFLKKHSHALYFVPLKNNKPLKKQIDDIVSYKPKLKFFFNEEEMIEEYKKDLKLVDGIIEKKFSAIFNFKKELQEAIN